MEGDSAPALCRGEPSLQAPARPHPQPHCCLPSPPGMSQPQKQPQRTGFSVDVHTPDSAQMPIRAASCFTGHAQPASPIQPAQRLTARTLLLSQSPSSLPTALATSPAWAALGWRKQASPCGKVHRASGQGTGNAGWTPRPSRSRSHHQSWTQSSERRERNHRQGWTRGRRVGLRTGALAAEDTDVADTSAGQTQSRGGHRSEMTQSTGLEKAKRAE